MGEDMLVMWHQSGYWTLLCTYGVWYKGWTGTGP